jgi:hypothetical protein
MRAEDEQDHVFDATRPCHVNPALPEMQDLTQRGEKVICDLC